MTDDCFSKCPIGIPKTKSFPRKLPNNSWKSGWEVVNWLERNQVELWLSVYSDGWKYDAIIITRENDLGRNTSW